MGNSLTHQVLVLLADQAFLCLLLSWQPATLRVAACLDDSRDLEALARQGRGAESTKVTQIQHPMSR